MIVSWSRGSFTSNDGLRFTTFSNTWLKTGDYYLCSGTFRKTVAGRLSLVMIASCFSLHFTQYSNCSASGLKVESAWIYISYATILIFLWVNVSKQGKFYFCLCVSCSCLIDTGRRSDIHVHTWVSRMRQASMNANVKQSLTSAWKMTFPGLVAHLRPF